MLQVLSVHGKSTAHIGGSPVHYTAAYRISDLAYKIGDHWKDIQTL